MSFYELIKNRRSVRKFQEQSVESWKTEQITRAALMSPASKRSNPWEFIAIEDKSTLLKLSECRTGSSKLIAGAPLAIVVIADTSKSNVWFEDASIAASFIQLQAEDLGLGSCWVQVYLRDKDENMSAENYIRQLLNIPENFAVLCVLAIGYKAEEKAPHDEEKLQYEKIHFEKFQ